MPRHSWSPDMLSIVSPSANVTIKQGSVAAVLTKPEIFWANSASADSEARLDKAPQRRIWHGGDVGVDVDTRRCQIRVSQAAHI